MTRYEYVEEVKNDVIDAIENDYDLADFASREEVEQTLYDDLFISDSVTGNASGSYYCNTWKAEEALAHSWDLIEEVAAEFGYEPTISASYENGAEAWDVRIRCYLLPEAIGEALDEIDYNFDEDTAEAVS